MRGQLVVIEGPNGVGKSTLTQGLAKHLAGLGHRIYTATQPSSRQLGQYLRTAEENLTGRAFALALAADRYDQEAREIQPRLDAGDTVLMDRYVHSSLVLQRLDGLPLDEIWSYNCHVLQPELTLLLEADPAVVQGRLDARARLSRLEREGSPEQEARFYAEAITFLTGQGWQHHTIDTRSLDPDGVLEEGLKFIISRG